MFQLEEINFLSRDFLFLAVSVISFVMFLVCRLKYPYSFFFTFFFVRCCFTACPYRVITITGYRNSSFLVLFQNHSSFLVRCYNAIFNVGLSSSRSFLDTDRLWVLSDVWLCVSTFLCTVVRVSLLSTFRMIQSILQEKLSICVIFWWDFSSRVFQDVLWFFWGTFFLFFHLFLWWRSPQIFAGTCNFLFL